MNGVPIVLLSFSFIIDCGHSNDSKLTEI